MSPFVTRKRLIPTARTSSTRVLITLTFALLVHVCIAQQRSYLDSLNLEVRKMGCLNRQVSDSLIDVALKAAIEKNFHAQIGDAYGNMARILQCDGAYQEAIHYVRKSIGYFQLVNDLPREGAVISIITAAYRKIYKIDSSLWYARRLLEIGLLTGDSLWNAKAYSNFASGYIENHQHDSALYYSIAGLKIAESLPTRPDFYPALLHNLAISYNMEGDLQNAKRMYLKSERAYREGNYRHGLSLNIYNNLGLCLIDLGEYDSAIFVFNQGLELNEKINDSFMEAYITRGMGNAFWLKGDSSKAIEYNLWSMDLSREFSLVGNLAVALCNLTKFYNLMGDTQSAIRYGEEGLRVTETSKNLGIRKVILANLAAAYESGGYLAKSLEALKEQMTIEKELQEAAKSREFARLQTQHETEQKEAQIQSLSQEKQIQSLQLRQQQYVSIGLGGFLLLIIIGTFLVARQRKLKETQKLTELELQETQKRLKLEQQYRASELKALRSQMNPHFTFNALNSIQEYIMSNERKLAGKYLGKFADLMRTYLNHSQERKISIADETEALGLYMELEALRFEESLTCELYVDPALDPHLEIPSLLLQPYVENAFKHGLLHKEGERILKISLHSMGEHLVCEIADNGIGRKRSRELNEMRNFYHKSFATQATKSRLELLNQDRVQAITEEIEDLVDENNLGIGTKITIRIPLNDTMETETWHSEIK